MSHKYLYVFNRVKSREFDDVGRSIAVGAALVKREADWITYHVGVEGENIGRARPFPEAKDRAEELRRKLGVGKRVILASKANGKGSILEQVKFLEVLPVDEVPDGPGVEGIDRFEAFVRSHFPNARWAGTCVCKPDSDHADCAATDWFDTYANMAKMVAEVRANPSHYRMKYAILKDRIYFPDGTSRYYSGVYHTHVHFSCFGGIDGAAC